MASESVEKLEIEGNGAFSSVFCKQIRKIQKGCDALATATYSSFCCGLCLH